MTRSEWSVSSSFSSPSSPLVILRLTAMHTSLSQPRRNLSFISYLSSPRATCCVQLAAGLSCTQQQLLIVALLPISTAVHHEPAAPKSPKVFILFLCLEKDSRSILQPYSLYFLSRWLVTITFVTVTVLLPKLKLLREKYWFREEI